MRSLASGTESTSARTSSGVSDLACNVSSLRPSPFANSNSRCCSSNFSNLKPSPCQSSGIGLYSRGVSLDDDARAELKQLEAIGRLRVPRVVDGRAGPRITLDGTRGAQPRVERLPVARGRSAARRRRRRRRSTRTASVRGASRLIVGQSSPARRARARGRGLDARAVRCGCSTRATRRTSGAIAALLGAGDVVFSDELNHASIIDGCRLSRAQVVVFPHRDLAALDENCAQRAGAGGSWSASRCSRWMAISRMSRGSRRSRSGTVRR